MKTALRRLVLGAALLSLPAVVRAQTAVQDVKNAGHDTANATKKTAHKVKHSTQKGVNKAAHGTSKGAGKVEQKTDPNQPK